MPADADLSSLRSRSQEIAAILFERLASRKTHHELRQQLQALTQIDEKLDVDESIITTLAPEGLRELFRELCAVYVDRFQMNFERRTCAFVSSVLPAVLGAAFASRWNALRPLRSFDHAVRCHGAIEDLESLRKTGTVVFACAHSSNLDSLVIGLALKRAGFPPCVYPAGKHLYRQRAAACMVSRLGAYQLDRGLDSSLYKEIVVAYSTLLIEEDCHSVIFPSGTRARDGAIDRHLELGLVGSILEAARNRQAQARPRPVFVVPVCASYEVTPEARHLIQYDLQGRAHERVVGDELGNQGTLQSLARKVWRFEESVSIGFGKAIEVSNLESHNVEKTRSLGRSIARSFQAASIVYPTHLVCRALLSLIAGEPCDRHAIAKLLDQKHSGISLPDVLQEIDSVRETLDANPWAGSIETGSRHATSIQLLHRAQHALEQCHEGGVFSCTEANVIPRDLPLLYFYSNRTTHLFGDAQSH